MQRVALVTLDGKHGKITPEYQKEQISLQRRLQAQVTALAHCAVALRTFRGYNVGDLPGYLDACSGEVNNILDRMDLAVGHTSASAVEIRTAASAGEGTLRDVLTDILESAHKQRSNFAKVYTIPAAFRGALRHDAGVKELQGIVPPISGPQKRAAQRVFDSEGLDAFMPTIQSKDLTAVYLRAIETYRNNLKNGTLRGGGYGETVFKVKCRAKHTVEYVLLSHEDSSVQWTLAFKTTAFTTCGLIFRFVLKSDGIARVLNSWVQGAMAAMQDATEDPEAELNYQVEMIGHAIRDGEDHILRSWAGDKVHSEVSLGETPDTCVIKLELLRATELTFDTDPNTKRKQFLRFHAYNRTLMGGRHSAEEKAKEAIHKLGGDVQGVQEIKDHSADLRTNGFRFFLTTPLAVDRTKLVKSLADLAWSLGKGKRDDSDDAETIKTFEAQHGVSTSKAQSLKRTRAAEQGKLLQKITEILNSSEIMLSDKMRKQLERLEWGMQNKAVTDLNSLMITIPARLEMIEERFTRTRKASVGSRSVMDLQKLHGFLQRQCRIPYTLSTRLQEHGVTKEAIPTSAKLTQMLVAQAQNDIHRTGVGPDRMILRIPHGVVAESKECLSQVVTAGMTLRFGNERDVLVVDAQLHPLTIQQMSL